MRSTKIIHVVDCHTEREIVDGVAPPPAASVYKQSCSIMRDNTWRNLVLQKPRGSDRAVTHFLEFFAAQVRETAPRRSYRRGVDDFLAWLKAYGLALITDTAYQIQSIFASNGEDVTCAA